MVKERNIFKRMVSSVTLLFFLATLVVHTSGSWCTNMPIVGSFIIFNESCPFESTVEVNAGLLNLTGTFNETTNTYTTFFRKSTSVKLRHFTVSDVGILYLKFLNLTQGLADSKTSSTLN